MDVREPLVDTRGIDHASGVSDDLRIPEVVLKSLVVCEQQSLSAHSSQCQHMRVIGFAPTFLRNVVWSNPDAVASVTDLHADPVDDVVTMRFDDESSIGTRD